MTLVLVVLWASVLPVAFIVLVVRQLRKYPSVAQAGREAVRESWLIWIGAAHLALLVVLAGYLTMVGFNTFAYDYSFWNDPPPSEAADAGAVISLWVLYVFLCLVAAATYGWMCGRAGSDGQGQETARVAFRRALSNAPIAVPAFAVLLMTLPFSIPAAGVIAALGAAPFRSSSELMVAWTDYWAFVRSSFSALLAVGLTFSLLAIPIDATVLLGFYLTQNHNGPIEGTVLPLMWLTFVLASLAAGWAAGCFRRVWMDAQPTPA